MFLFLRYILKHLHECGLWNSLVCLLQTRWLSQNSECNHEIRGWTAGSHHQDFSWALIIDHDFLYFSLFLKCAPFLVSLFNSPCKFVCQNNVRFSQVCHSKNTLLEQSVSNCKTNIKIMIWVKSLSKRGPEIQLSGRRGA